MNIKPIETAFGGHLFRSRLEARWAVFFRDLGVHYEYEAEGYELGTGVRYLPDFLLPSQSLHVEIKPSRSMTTLDMRKIAMFTVDRPLLLIVGTPGEHEMLYIESNLLGGWAKLQTSIREFGADVFFENLSLVTFDFLPGKQGWHVVYQHSAPYVDCTRHMAFHAARAARFEHGRSGN
jgi:hypothetical protein